MLVGIFEFKRMLLLISHIFVYYTPYVGVKDVGMYTFCANKKMKQLLLCVYFMTLACLSP